MSYIPNRLRSISRKIYYHEALVLLPSALPMLISVSLTSLLFSLVSWYNPTVIDTYISNNTYFLVFVILILSLIEVVLTITVWLSDTLVESTLGGYYTAIVRKNIRYGFYAFILSEAMLFFSFFWAFLHSGFSPTVQIGSVFPPTGTTSVLITGLPLWGTFLLIASGYLITWMNKTIIISKSMRIEFLVALLCTIGFGVTFMILQITEYISFSTNFNDSIFGSCFYMLTGFHGFHVFLGLVFLGTCVWLHYKRVFLDTVHVFLEVSIVYWHFVDIIWIGLFFIVYMWGFGDLGTIVNETDNLQLLTEYTTYIYNNGGVGNEVVFNWSEGSSVNDFIAITKDLGFISLYKIPFNGEGLYNWQMFFQYPATDSARELILFHGYLCTLIIILAVFVFDILAKILIHFESKPYSKRASVNYTVYQVLEFWWTVIPGLIILGLSISSLLLIYTWDVGLGISLEGRHRNLLNTVMLKVRGSQWFWTYEYVSQLYFGLINLENQVSNVNNKINFNIDRLLKYESHIASTNQYSDKVLLETTAAIKLPLGWIVKFVVTASDVIHSWAVPSFGMKVDAIPGRANVQSIIPKLQGKFYGQCSEICGIKHAFMPIEVEVLGVTWLKWYIKQSSPRMLIGSKWKDHYKMLMSLSLNGYNSSEKEVLDEQPKTTLQVEETTYVNKSENEIKTIESLVIESSKVSDVDIVVANTVQTESSVSDLKSPSILQKTLFGLALMINLRSLSGDSKWSLNIKRSSKNSVIKTKLKRLALIQKNSFKILNDIHNYWYMTPGNLGNSYAMGFLLLFSIIIQILTGMFLVANYEPSIIGAFNSVIWLKRDVFAGGYVQSVHSIGASIIFMSIYLHLFRGLYFASYKKRNTWITGICIYFLVALIAFLGYCLPWGQMSLWGCKVITSFLTALPYLGTILVEWVWGGASINDQTLKRFYMAHIGLNAILIFFIGLHIRALHVYGSSSPTSTLGSGSIVFFPYIPLKDIFMVYSYVTIVLLTLYINQNLFSHPENFIPANPMVTPDHIVPEWYFLPFYAILRSIPNKELGLIAMLGSIIVWATLPWLSGDNYKGRDNIYFTQGFIAMIYIVLLLGWLGTQPLRQPYTNVASTFTLIYFFYFFIFFPKVTKMKLRIKRTRRRWTRLLGAFRKFIRKYVLISEERYMRLKRAQELYRAKRRIKLKKKRNATWANLYAIKRTMKH